MRLSAETQHLLASIEDRTDIDWMDIISGLQTKLITEAIGENATEDEVQHGLRIIRSAQQLYANDDEFRTLSLYVRYNRARVGDLTMGDRAIDIDLLNMDVPQLNELMDYYQGRADIVTVYIEEAHATDEWPIGSRICYLQPKSDADRIRIADDFIKSTGYRILLLIDPVSRNNPFSQVYAPWPIRFYVIDQMKNLSYIAQPIQGSFPLEFIRNALDQAIVQQS
ncbi:unnamed protein product [Didymodactylos carnosus]|uniref:Iodothyronine deiodinase n=1 Tax=Didymodactylos carnosus TaxID=1234261 RepID=A0A814NBR4_9BILA|nr:unnamed protein product [Didymodactylos carnosus]CAF1091344.1 unnamed protein product [Didymodactylos carnosus]CAF3825526.1 unnamed protein product [Didymodactylos carnosus]CAF3856828.1 unnamed protein product [Didymodactylos carnosus]